MHTNPKKNFAIIGNNFDLIEYCTSRFNKDNYKFVCFFSENIALREALANIVTYIPGTIHEFLEFIKQNKLDYLFSIENPYIIPSDIIEYGSEATINYHNSLLPAYGGQHSVVWPIWYNEQESGVTWHKVSSLLDGGDILVQKKFNIEPNETAFSLGLKCQEAGKSSFIELIEKLAKPNGLKGLPQNLNKRSLYYSFSRPCGFAIIDFNDSAENIHRQFRALDFGTKNNPITTQKFKIKDKVYAVLNITILSDKRSETPGIIKNITGNKVQITTATKDILIDFKSLPYDLDAEFDNRSIGEQLCMPGSNIAEKYRTIAETVAKDELYWLNQLSSFKPGKHFVQNRHTLYKNYQEICNFSLNELPDMFLAEPSLIRMAQILSILAGYLYKINDYENFSICLSGLHSNSVDDVIDTLCSNIIPLNFDLTELDYYHVKNDITNTLNTIKNKKLYLKDLLLRYPGSNAILSNAILIDFSGLEHVSNYHPIIISINLNTYEIKLLVAKNYDAPLFLTFIKSHLILLINHWVIEDKKLNEICLVSEQEWGHLKLWNNTVAEYPQNKSIPQLLDDICAKFPDNIALETCKVKLTYRELKRDTDSLAQKILLLTNADDYIGEKIAVFLDKSIYAIVTFIAVLKTGAAYIVLDTSYPDGYVENVINTSQANFYLTSESNSERLKAIITKVKLRSSKTLVIDRLMDNDFSQSIKLPKLPTIPRDSLAYILFTSGSTGKPKGIMISQESLANFTYSVIKDLGIRETDKALQFATLAFDTSIWEIYNTLLAGATLYIPEKSEVIVGESFENTIINKNLTILIIAPSILNIQPFFKSERLRTLIVGGEACPKNVLLTWGANYHLINVYGPSECTVISTISGDLNADDEVTIGKPLANCQITICDRYRLPQVLGAIGEIVISGVGVGKGYLNNPELTKQKFPTVNFFGKEQIGYFSGDTGRWVQNGELLYCGRTDFQIKIGGRLIDLEAIEGAVIGYEGVHTCVVLANIISANNTILNAYILLESQNSSIELELLKSFLRSQLPCFMIPSKFFIIDYLPLTASGKVDRQKLLINNWHQLADTAKTLPNTRMQKELSSIWQEITGISHALDIDTEFFKFGGTSLQITQMILKLIKQYNVQISISEFLRCPTIKHLEEMITAKPGDNIERLEVIVNQDLLKFKKLLTSEKFTNPQTGFAKKVKKVLLTGITGFLGSYLARYLLNNDIEVYCIVRTSNPESFSDVKAKLKVKGWNNTNLSKLLLINGDVSKDFFGINAELYQQLANDIDAVCNCAAFVNHVFHYNQLKDVNVYGVWHCIEFCHTNKPKYFAHISALSALSILKTNNGQEDFINLENCKAFNNLSGYNLTKVVAELSINELIKQIPLSMVKIYRPGLIGADSATGVQDYENNHLTLLMKGCLQMGAAPEWDDLPINLLPVDYIAQFIVSSFLQIVEEKKWRKVYNILTGELLSFNDISCYFAEKTASKISVITFVEWQKLLSGLQPDNALYPLLPLYLEHSNEAITGVYKTIVNAQNDLFIAELDKLKIRSVPPIKQQLSKYIDFLSSKKFLI